MTEQVAKELSSNTVNFILKRGSGKIKVVCVNVAGSQIEFYDSVSQSPSVSDRIALVSGANLGPVQVNIPFSVGLVVAAPTPGVYSVTFE